MQATIPPAGWDAIWALLGSLAGWIASKVHTRKGRSKRSG
jgi:uncharacterized membrane protein YeaQ/YmgE (transglycosylase-associated protein family)